MIKSVCICSSLKFYERVLALKKRLTQEGIKCLTPLPNPKYRKQDNPGELIENFSQIPEKEILHDARSAALDHFSRIDDADIVYIITEKGYVGKSVCMEVGYAHARQKPIYCSEKLDDHSVMSLVHGILPAQDLITLLRK